MFRGIGSGFSLEEGSPLFCSPRNLVGDGSLLHTPIWVNGHENTCPWVPGTVRVKGRGRRRVSVRVRVRVRVRGRVRGRIRGRGRVRVRVSYRVRVRTTFER